MHGLISLFLRVIVLAIILLVVGFGALRVLIVALRATVVSIVSMTIVRLAIVAIASVTLMVVTIFVTTMLPVAQFTATCDRNLSRFLLFWLLLVLGNLLKHASLIVGCLTLLKESNHLERVSRHRLDQVCELELMCLGLREEDLFTLLLCRGYFYCSTEVATLEVADKLHLTPHELMHPHESGLLGCTKPANQLVVYIWESGNSLKVIPYALVEVYLYTICLI